MTLTERAERNAAEAARFIDQIAEEVGKDTARQQRVLDELDKAIERLGL